jgi:ADP-heptose:LPS heptosyltransferase
MSPSEAAAACLAWIAGRDAATVDRELADLSHPTYAHAETLADAADSSDEAVRSAGLTALFAGLVEPLNDGFTPAGRAGYARWFTRICWRIASREPALSQRLASFGIATEAALHARYQAARHTPPTAPANAAKVVVLSRVTIGADLLLTTVVLQRLRRAFPQAELVVLGDAKLAALVGGFPGVRVRALAYGRRGPLRERLGAWLTLADAVAEEQPDLVIAPDSRLDQLGILPVCAAEKYVLWENVLPVGQALPLCRSLDAFLARWLGQTVLPAVEPRTMLDAATVAERERFKLVIGPRPLASVKLDHGGNPAKALPRAAEVALLRTLRDRGWRILIDRGFGPAETANNDALLAAAGLSAVDLRDTEVREADVLRFEGSIGGWAAACACAQLAVSYDSVGHHLAAGLGVPVITAFTGHADARFATAWTPHGPGKVTLIVIPTALKEQPQQWQELFAAVPTT